MSSPSSHPSLRLDHSTPTLQSSLPTQITTIVLPSSSISPTAPGPSPNVATRPADPASTTLTFDADSSLSDLEDLNSQPCLTTIVEKEPRPKATNRSGITQPKRRQKKQAGPAGAKEFLVAGLYASSPLFPSSSIGMRSSASKSAASPITPAPEAEGSVETVKRPKRASRLNWFYEPVNPDGSTVGGRLTVEQEIAEAIRQGEERAAEIATRSAEASDEENVPRSMRLRLRTMTPRPVRATTPSTAPAQVQVGRITRARHSLPATLNRASPAQVKLEHAGPVKREVDASESTSNLDLDRPVPIPGLPYPLTARYLAGICASTLDDHRQDEMELGPIKPFAGELPPAFVQLRENDPSRGESGHQRALYEVGRLLRIEQLRGSTDKATARADEAIVTISANSDRTGEVFKPPSSVDGRATTTTRTGGTDLLSLRTNLFKAAFSPDKPLTSVPSGTSIAPLLLSSALASSRRDSHLPTPASSSKSVSSAQPLPFAFPLPIHDGLHLLEDETDFCLPHDILWELNHGELGKKRKRVPGPYKLIQKSQLAIFAHPSAHVLFAFDSSNGLLIRFLVFIGNLGIRYVCGAK